MSKAVRRSPRFVDACRVAAAGLALVVCTHAGASNQYFNRPAAIKTAAIEKLNKLLPDQSKPAVEISTEQAQTLSYGIFPPVKTSIWYQGKNQTHWTLHPFDLVALARGAASEVSRTTGFKVDPRKIGAIMMAESSLVARTGWSANGKTPSFGLAQLEMKTAKALWVKNPNDPAESALAVAKLIVEGMRFARANSSVDDRIAFSLFYNTSTALRKSFVAKYGSALSIADLPPATQGHVTKMADGEHRMALFISLSGPHEKLTSKKRI